MKVERDITVGARVSFATVSQIPDRLSGVDFAIELALPYRYEWWKESARQLDEMMSLLDVPGLIVSTVHATQAPITRDVGAEELRPPCDRYRSMDEMYGHNAPPPDEATR